jgi:glycosyltransferase involved in cell wall biosynthesis
VKKNWKSDLIRSEIGRFCLGRMAELYDRWICTPEAVRRQVVKRVEQGKGLKFSVGIPHHNRGGEIYKPLFNAIQHPNVKEIVIVDDGSNEGEFEKLHSFVMSLKGEKPIALHRRNENKKALFTKVEVVEKCCGEWILVLDSDNTFFKKTLDAFSGLEAPSRDTFYCCSFAFPFFDFSPIGYAALDFERISSLAKQGLLQKYYIMNDGNYLVNKKSYLSSARMIGETQNDEADVITLNYAHVSQGGKLKLIQKSRYFHRVHKRSRWILNADASKKRLNQIYSRLREQKPFDSQFCEIIRHG